jgi:hypothetical protein
MDDIRRPQQPTRRDYALPGHLPPPQQQPHPQSMHHSAGQHLAHPQPLPVHPQPEPPAPAEYQRTQPLPPIHQEKPRTRNNHKLFTIGAGALLAAAAIFGAGWMLKGNSSDPNTIPASVVRRVNYSLYFPSPMPPGYSYMKDTATFQIGQIYFKFAAGSKRVTVMEQPMPGKKPDLSLMSGFSQFNSSIGKAAVGDNLGQATAVVLTPTTVITLHTVGGVGQDELKTAINNMKNIGQNPKGSYNG